VAAAVALAWYGASLRLGPQPVWPSTTPAALGQQVLLIMAGDSCDPERAAPPPGSWSATA